MRLIILSAILFANFISFTQTTDSSKTLSLLFMGDIMGHDSQINSARQSDGSYDYTEVFKFIKDDISAVDVAIANLEVTLAGPPYKGYPQFSSPDELAVAAKQAGIDIFGNANNHSLDRRKPGALRTIEILDSLKIPHTGTYSDIKQKELNSPLIIEKNGFKLALINYTYGTNGIPVPSPIIVDIINRDKIAADLQKAKLSNPDKIILFLHWGKEYQHNPNKNQKELAYFCFDKGADIIIGSHPHVIQKSNWITDSLHNETFITYSLGNFISNQRKRYTDGGQMIKIVLEKDHGKTNIIESGYFLTWVYTPKISDKKLFYILPCAKFELQPKFFISESHYNKMKLFISDSRNLLNSNNSNVGEYIYYKNEWVTP